MAAAAPDPLVAQHGPYFTWRFEPGTRYRIPLANGAVAEGTFEKRLRYIFSKFVNTSIPGHRADEDCFYLYHPPQHSPDRMRIEFDENGNEVSIDVSDAPMSLDNVRMIEAHAANRSFVNANVFSRQDKALTDEDAKEHVLSFTRAQFGPLKRFGGSKKRKRRRSRAIRRTVSRLKKFT